MKTFRIVVHQQLPGESVAQGYERMLSLGRRAHTLSRFHATPRLGDPATNRKVYALIAMHCGDWLNSHLESLFPSKFDERDVFLLGDYDDKIVNVIMVEAIKHAAAMMPALWDDKRVKVDLLFPAQPKSAPSPDAFLSVEPDNE